jgi:hypothetical protein
MARSIKEESKACLLCARLFLGGDHAEVTAESLAAFLFDQRCSARAFRDHTSDPEGKWIGDYDAGVE